METLRFLTESEASEVRERFGSPTYVYDETTLRAQATHALAFPNAFGLTVRYAMKAASNRAILRILNSMGLRIDASSGYEALRAMRAGVPANHICVSSQEWYPEFAELHAQGVHFNACSLDQIDRFGRLFPGEKLGIRFNPGLGSGGTQKTNVGGPASSFGIWHERVDEVQAALAAHNLTAIRIHSHIGSGSDPEVWKRVATLTLDLVRQFPDMEIANLGGGYKVGRMASESTTDLREIGAPVREQFEAFARETGRQLKLEIEPGTYLAANACSLVTTVQDRAETGREGYQFLKLDAGMTEILRPSLYAAQHPIVIVPKTPTDAIERYVVVGHCCESGDLLTPSENDPSGLNPRQLTRAELGDIAVIEGVGAYCSSLCGKNYNSFPEAAEVLLEESRNLRLIRRRQTLDQILQNEVDDAPAP